MQGCQTPDDRNCCQQYVQNSPTAGDLSCISTVSGSVRVNESTSIQTHHVTETRRLARSAAARRRAGLRSERLYWRAPASVLSRAPVAPAARTRSNSACRSARFCSNMASSSYLCELRACRM